MRWGSAPVRGALSVEDALSVFRDQFLVRKRGWEEDFGKISDEKLREAAKKTEEANKRASEAEAVKNRLSSNVESLKSRFEGQIKILEKNYEDNLNKALGENKSEAKAKMDRLTEEHNDTKSKLESEYTAKIKAAEEKAANAKIEAEKALKEKIQANEREYKIALENNLEASKNEQAKLANEFSDKERELKAALEEKLNLAKEDSDKVKKEFSAKRKELVKREGALMEKQKQLKNLEEAVKEMSRSTSNKPKRANTKNVRLMAKIKKLNNQIDNDKGQIRNLKEGKKKLEKEREKMQSELEAKTTEFEDKLREINETNKSRQNEALRRAVDDAMAMYNDDKDREELRGTLMASDATSSRLDDALTKLKNAGLPLETIERIGWLKGVTYFGSAADDNMLARELYKMKFKTLCEGASKTNDNCECDVAKKAFETAGGKTWRKKYFNTYDSDDSAYAIPLFMKGPLRDKSKKYSALLEAMHNSEDACGKLDTRLKSRGLGESNWVYARSAGCPNITKDTRVEEVEINDTKHYNVPSLVTKNGEELVCTTFNTAYRWPALIGQLYVPQEKGTVLTDFERVNPICEVTLNKDKCVPKKTFETWLMDEAEESLKKTAKGESSNVKTLIQQDMVRRLITDYRHGEDKGTLQNARVNIAQNKLDKAETVEEKAEAAKELAEAKEELAKTTARDMEGGGSLRELDAFCRDMAAKAGAAFDDRGGANNDDVRQWFAESIQGGALMTLFGEVENVKKHRVTSI